MIPEGKHVPGWLQRRYLVNYTPRDYRRTFDDRDRSDPHVRYTLCLYVQKPAWADQAKINGVYAEAARLRRRGEDVVVDHIVPLNSPLVCGLHVEHNLRITSRIGNAKKSNIWWPGCPFEQLAIDFGRRLWRQLELWSS